ncbi:MAG: T9SS type A sorting domain-containing protein [Candidatus Cloacimonadota bacterium]|nr:MAG: T9SS type A sorting domain-containing protein [Candidatus Cloacimonadota bacterium]
MKIRLGFIIFFCILAVSLTAQPARSDSIVRVGACATPGITWGVCVQDSFAYVADRGYVTTVNISDPTNPWVACSLNSGPPIGALGIYVQDTVAYCNLTALGTIFITISVAKPDSLYLLGWCYLSGGGVNDPTGVILKDTVVYLATSTRGVMQINVADPSSPDTIQAYDTPGYSIDLAVKDTLVYIADVDSLQIINVANPMNPLYVSSVSMPSSCRGIYVVDTFAYATCVSNFGNDGSLQIVKVSDPASPQIVASVNTLNGNPLDVWISGDYAYVAAADYWSIQKGKERHVGGIRPESASSERADVEGGLRIVNISDPLNPTVVASYDTPGDPRGVFAVDTLVFIADYDSLQILKHIVVGVKEKEMRKIGIGDLSLLQIYPNPFNAVTSIHYQLTRAEHITLKIYDVSGSLMKTLVNGVQKPGLHKFQWDGNVDSSGVPKSGFYFCQLTVGSKKINQKIVKIE